MVLIGHSSITFTIWNTVNTVIVILTLAAML